MALVTCVVSGTIKDLTGTALANVAIYADVPKPVFYGDGTLLPAYRVNTTTDANGAWSLTLVETTSISTQIQIIMDLPNGSSGTNRQNYYVTVPSQATASFSGLITGQ